MSEDAGLLNARCAGRLREAGDLLHAQGANPFRVSAYRKAAATVLDLPEDLATIIDRDGLPGLESLPNIGRGIASALLEMMRTGRSMRLGGVPGSVENMVAARCGRKPAPPDFGSNCNCLLAGVIRGLITRTGH